ncbi:unnamed protein product, partial [Scytosiphon promiscuus]
MASHKRSHRKQSHEGWHLLSCGGPSSGESFAVCSPVHFASVGESGGGSDSVGISRTRHSSYPLSLPPTRPLQPPDPLSEKPTRDLSWNRCCCRRDSSEISSRCCACLNSVEKRQPEGCSLRQCVVSSGRLPAARLFGLFSRKTVPKPRTPSRCPAVQHCTMV